MSEHIQVGSPQGETIPQGSDRLDILLKTFQIIADDETLTRGQKEVAMNLAMAQLGLSGTSSSDAAPATAVLEDAQPESVAPFVAHAPTTATIFSPATPETAPTQHIGQAKNSPTPAAVPEPPSQPAATNTATIPIPRRGGDSTAQPRHSRGELPFWCTKSRWTPTTDEDWRARTARLLAPTVMAAYYAVNAFCSILSVTGHDVKPVTTNVADCATPVAELTMQAQADQEWTIKYRGKKAVVRPVINGKPSLPHMDVQYPVKLVACRVDLAKDPVGFTDGTAVLRLSGIALKAVVQGAPEQTVGSFELSPQEGFTTKDVKALNKQAKSPKTAEALQRRLLLKALGLVETTDGCADAVYEAAERKIKDLLAEQLKRQGTGTRILTEGEIRPLLQYNRSTFRPDDLGPKNVALTNTQVTCQGGES